MNKTVLLGLLHFFICYATANANDQCANAVTLIPGVTCNYSSVNFTGASISAPLPTCAGNASQDVWYKFTATDSTARIELEAKAGLNHGFEIIEGSCTGTVLACVNSNLSGYSESYMNNQFHPGQTYFIRVFNAQAGLSTSSFGICLQTFPQPANNACTNVSTLVPQASCQFTSASLSGASISAPLPTCAGNASQDVWYKFTATDSTARIELEAKAGLNHGFEIIEGSCTGTVLACVNSNLSGYSESYMNNQFHPGQTYFIRVFNAQAGLSTSSFGICLQTFPQPANNACTNVSTLVPQASCQFTSASLSGASISVPLPTCAGNASQDVWYKFTATDSTARIELEAKAGLNHGFEIIEGSCTGTVLACVNSNLSGYSESYMNNQFHPGQTYFIRVFNAQAGLSTSSFGICVRSIEPSYCIPTAQISASQTTVCQSTTVTFTASITNGGQNPTYQWFINGVIQPNASNATFSSNTIADGDLVKCQLISNASCANPQQVESNTIQVHVSLKTIDTTISINDFTLSSNEPDASYQWLDCNTNSVIANATERSYTIENSGRYAVILQQGICIDTSECVLVNTVGFSHKETEVKVFPNPFQQQLFVHGGTEHSIIQLYDIGGRMISENKINKGPIGILYTSEVPIGMYYLKLSPENIFIKVFKQ